MGKKKKSRRGLTVVKPNVGRRAKYSDNTLVSVILITEQTEDDGIFTVVKNIVEEQTHKKIDLIISSFREQEDCSDIMDRCSKLHLEIRWIFHEPDNNFIEDLSSLAEGEVVFYKTTNNCLWFPRHLQLHLETYSKDSGYGFCLSRLEQRNLDAPDTQFNTLAWRIDNVPDIDSIILDEISHIGHVETDWSQCLKDNDGTPLFFAGIVLKQWIGEKKLRGGIPDEISVIEWKPVQGEAQSTDKNVEDFYNQIGIPVATDTEEEVIETEEGLEINVNFPTIVGSKYHSDHSERVRQMVDEQDEIDSIAIKRTMGLGDILLVEPIIRKLKEKYNNAPITFYTAKPDIIKYFKHKPDKVEKVEENEVVKDILHDKPERVKIDLDLAYESRDDCQFIDGYAEVAVIKFDNQRDKCPQLVYDKEKVISNKYAVVVADGSGWPGKSWSIDKYGEVIDYVKSMGYEVYEPGYEVTDKTNFEYHRSDFEQMINLIANCEFYIGADNGPMHIARAFDRPCVAINGAALTYLSNPNREDIIYVEDSTNEGHGIKHRTFFTLAGTGLTFVPQYDEDPSSGLNNIESYHVIDAINKLFSTRYNNKFTFNIPGSISRRDVIPGLAYFKDEDDVYHRENPSYHPDQRINISSVYEDHAENIWKNNFSIIHKDIESDWSDINESPSILDVGCNMGIFINGMYKEGYSDVTGYDINRPSINKGQSTYPDISDKLILKDFTKIIDETDKYDIVLASDVISYVGSPLDLIKNISKVLKPNGVCYLNSLVIDSEEFIKDPRRWPPMGNGEHITLFSSHGLKKIINSNGLIGSEYGAWENDVNEMVFWKCRKG